TPQRSTSMVTGAARPATFRTDAAGPAFATPAGRNSATTATIASTTRGDRRGRKTRRRTNMGPPRRGRHTADRILYTTAYTPSPAFAVTRTDRDHSQRPTAPVSARTIGAVTTPPPYPAQPYPPAVSQSGPHA